MSKEIQNVTDLRNAINEAGKDLKDFGNAVSSIGKVITPFSENAGNGFLAVGAAINNASVMVTGFGAAINLLSGNPVIAVAAALTTVVIAINEASKAWVENNSLYKESCIQAASLREETEKLTQSYFESAQARNDIMKSFDNEAKTAELLTKKLEDMIVVGDKSAAQHAAIQATVDQLNRIYPQLGLNYDEVTGKLSKSTEEIKKYIAGMKEKAKLEAATNNYTAALEAQQKIEKALEEARESRDKASIELKKAEAAVEAARSRKTKTTDTAADIAAALSALDMAQISAENAKKAYEDQTASVDQLDKALTAVNDEVSYYDKLISTTAEEQAQYVMEEKALAEGRKMTQDEFISLLNQQRDVENQLNDEKAKQKIAQDELNAARDAYNKLFDEDPASEQTQQAAIAFSNAKIAANEANDSVNNLESQFASLSAATENARIGLDEVTEANEGVVESTDQSAEFCQNGASNMTGYIDGELSKAPEVIDTTGQIVTDASSSATEIAQSEFPLVGEAADQGIVAGVEESSSVVDDAVEKMTSSAIDVAKEKADTQAPEIGEAISSGTIKGIELGIPAVQAAARKMAQAAYNAAMAQLNANSPSRVFKYIGKDVIAKGQAIGIEKGIPYVTEAVGELSDATVNKAVQKSRSIDSFTLGTSNMPATVIGAGLLVNLAGNSSGVDYDQISILFNAAAEKIADSMPKEMALYDREMRRVVLGALQ